MQYKFLRMTVHHDNIAACCHEVLLTATESMLTQLLFIGIDHFILEAWLLIQVSNFYMRQLCCQGHADLYVFQVMSSILPCLSAGRSTLHPKKRFTSFMKKLTSKVGRGITNIFTRNRSTQHHSHLPRSLKRRMGKYHHYEDVEVGEIPHRFFQSAIERQEGIPNTCLFWCPILCWQQHVWFLSGTSVHVYRVRIFHTSFSGLFT